MKRKLACITNRMRYIIFNVHIEERRNREESGVFATHSYQRIYTFVNAGVVKVTGTPKLLNVKVGYLMLFFVIFDYQ